MLLAEMREASSQREKVEERCPKYANGFERINKKNLVPLEVGSEIKRPKSKIICKVREVIYDIHKKLE